MSRGVHTLRWLAHTPWPILALDMLRANLIGALFTFAFLRFGMPDADAVALNDISAQNQIYYLLYLVVALLVGTWASIQLSLPAMIWNRRRSRLDDEKSRKRALALPTLLSMLSAVLWMVGGLLLTVLNLRSSFKEAVLVALGSLVGGLVTCVLSFVQSERVLRPITAAAMANDPEMMVSKDRQTNFLTNITSRILVFWTITVAVPMMVIITLIVLQRTQIIDAGPQDIQRPILWMAIAALSFGVLAYFRLVSSINDPIKQLRMAMNQVRDGNYNVAVKIYDRNDLGTLQAGFNQMVEDLRERNELRNLFGRYVGEDVARRAIETGTELGGTERYVGVLFVDIVGSTRLAVTRPPREVVELLNDFFEIVVDVVGRHGGFVNKFQGDAALAIFGAPLDQDDFAGAALAAGRDLRVELTRRLGDVDMGIGVSAGKAVAGHIGSQQRLEYTVIGDPVNEAARLTELAKDEPTRVLGSARAVFLASDAEADNWQIGEGIELRGRGIETLLARPKLDRIAPDVLAGTDPDAEPGTRVSDD